MFYFYLELFAALFVTYCLLKVLIWLKSRSGADAVLCLSSGRNVRIVDAAFRQLADTLSQLSMALVVEAALAGDRRG